MSIQDEIKQARKQNREDERLYSAEKAAQRALEHQREYEKYSRERRDKVTAAATLRSDEQSKEYYAQSAQEGQQRMLMDMLESGDPRAQVLLGSNFGGGGGGGGGGRGISDIRDAHRDIISEYKDTQVPGADTPSFEEYLADRLPKVLAERGIGGDGQSSFADQMKAFKQERTQQAAAQGLHGKHNTIISKVDSFGNHIQADQKGYRKFTLGGPDGTPSGPIPATSIIQTGLDPMKVPEYTPASNRMSMPEGVSISHSGFPGLTSKQSQTSTPTVTNTLEQSTDRPRSALDYATSGIVKFLQKAVPAGEQFVHAANTAMFGVDDPIMKPVELAQNINRVLFGQRDPFSKDSLTSFMDRRIGPKKLKDKDEEKRPLGRRIGQALKRY